MDKRHIDVCVCVCVCVQSGLTEASRCSRVGLGEAEEQMLEFVKQNVPAGRCPLAGNTIHMDKRFLDKYMPRLMQHLHYRIVDVSSVKELCRYVHTWLFVKSETSLPIHAQFSTFYKIN